MTRRKGNASGPVRRGGGAGQRVKQFAVERGIRVPTSLVQIIAPDTPATPYAVGPAVANELASGDASPSSKSRRGATGRPPEKKAAPRTRAAPAKQSAAPKKAAKPPGKSARRKSR